MEVWDRRSYRGNKVWVLVDPAGDPRQDARGLVPMRYRPQDRRTYTVRASEVGGLRPETAPLAVHGDIVHAWALARRDPACDALGIGVALAFGHHRRDVERRIEPAGALRPDPAAAAAALRVLRRRDLPVRLEVPSPDVVSDDPEFAALAGGWPGLHVVGMRPGPGAALAERLAVAAAGDAGDRGASPCPPT